jgi:hypothetical protein
LAQTNEQTRTGLAAKRKKNLECSGAARQKKKILSALEPPDFRIWRKFLFAQLACSDFGSK